MKKHLYPYLVVALVAILTVLLYIYSWITMPTDGTTWVMERDTAVVHAVQLGSAGEKAGLLVNDKILSVDGHHAELYFAYEMHYRYFTVGATVEYKVFRNGDIVTLPITLESLWSTSPIYFYSYYALIVSILIVGVFVFLKRYEDPSARIFFVFTECFGVGIIGTATGFNAVGILGWSFFCLAIAFQGPLLFHFFLLFPERHMLIDRFPRLPKILYLTGLPLWCFASITPIVWAITNTRESETIAWVSFGMGVIWMGMNLIAAVVFAMRKFFAGPKSLGHKQLRWVIIGMLFGIIPHIVFGLIPWLAWSIYGTNPQLFHLCLGSGAFIFVAATSLALFRYRFWDIEVALKRTLLYGSITLLMIGLFLTLVYLVEILGVEHIEIVHLLGVVGAAILFLPVRELLQRRIDRLFHREKYDATLVIERFEHLLAGVYQRERLYNEITRVLDDVFHFKSFALFMKRDHNLYVCEALMGSDKKEKALEFNSSREIEDKFVKRKPISMSEFGKEIIIPQYLNIDLVVPLVFDNKVEGLFACGQKQSEHRYSMQDIQLLSVLAQRAATLLRTAELYERNQHSSQEFTRQLIESQESQRKRVAGELHDGIGQELIVIMNRSLLALKAQSIEKVKEQLDEITQSTARAIEEVREIAYDLSPYHLDQLGLTESVRTMVEKMAGLTAIEFSMNIDPIDSRLLKNVEINVYRIIQECVNNIVKHSKASRADIIINDHPHQIEIMVCDDGVGFDVSTGGVHEGKRRGFGLAGLCERVSLLSGSLQIRSSSGKGTTVRITIPYSSLTSAQSPQGAL